MSDATRKAIDRIGKYKYPLIVLVIGIFIMLLPTGGKSAAAEKITVPEASRDVERMEYVLSGVDGAGEVRVLLSDNGAVIVCAGANNARVRLELTEAVKAYTGFGSDRITILKIQDRYIGEETT